MGAHARKEQVPFSLVELETLLRRVIREELARLPGSVPPSVVDDWGHEGPDDPAGDEELLADALAAAREHRANPEGWLSWAEFEAEIERAEAAGELPD